MNILVTGYRGYIGSRLVPEMEKCGYRIIPFAGDVTHLPHWASNISNETPNVIIHMASMNGLRDCEIRPDYSFVNNYLSTFYAGQTAHAVGARLIFTTSTTAGRYDTIYEQDRGRALDILRTMRGLDLVSLSLSTVYGDSPTRAGKGRGVVNAWVEMAKRGESISVYREVAGKQRDYVYVGDVVQQIIGALDAHVGAYEVCTRIPMTILEAATEIANRWSVNVRLTDPQEPLFPVEKRNEYIEYPLWMHPNFKWTSFRDGIERMA